EKTLEDPITNKKNVVRNHLKICKYFHTKLGSQEAVDEYCNRTDNEEDKMIISNRWVFSWIRNPKTKELFEFLNPALTLPSQHLLSNYILKAERTNYIKSRKQKIKKDKIGVTLAFDGCKNILKQHIFGSLFILSTGEIENMIQNVSNLKAKLLAIVSDTQFITYYYKAWFGCQPTRILLELEEYRKRRYPFDFVTYKQFEDNMLQFWEFVLSSTKELGPLAENQLRDWEKILMNEEVARLKEEEEK
ncbi:3785_t:CDS:2, partial [Cetraspora pellucida]